MKITKVKWEVRANDDGSWTVMSGNIVIAILDRKDNPESNEANAKLIAASPDMLKLLNDILEWDGILPHSKTRIRQIIAETK